MAQSSKWKQPLHQLRRQAAKSWLRLNPKVKIIGVTGSYGKTNTTRAIAQVLSQKAPALQTDLNLDTIYNLPITLLKLRPLHRFLVLEYGVDHQREMDFHLSLVKPEIGVVTGINPTHSEPELLGSLAGVVKEKGKLLESLPPSGVALLNWDDAQVRKMAVKTKAKVVKYGFSPAAEIRAEQVKVNFSGTSFVLNFAGKKQKLRTGLIGKHFLHTCLVAVAIGRREGLSWAQIKKGLASLKPLSGRLSLEKGPRGTMLLNDSLRANPASTLAGLQTLAALPCPAKGGGRKIAVLGEMGELGIMAESEHQRIGEKLAGFKLDYLVSIGPLQKLTAEAAAKAGMNRNQVFWTKDVVEASQVLKKILKKGDLWYLKGSLLRHLERIPLLLKGKKVACQVVSCHQYHQCPECHYLQSRAA